ncbi:MAG: hypothetical protein KAT25_02915 [Sulfuriflexus sp.]|nr:hypothetical protein [Sulfuriflexus sp.]
MLTYAIILLAITAVGGLVLAASVLREKLAPWPLSIVHALLGAAGLVILVLLALGESTSMQSTVALGLLVVAALGGFYLASLHLRGKVAPKAVVIIHAGVAVAGFLTLVSIVVSV